jgi:hypothetical protein
VRRRRAKRTELSAACENGSASFPGEGSVRFELKTEKKYVLLYVCWELPCPGGCRGRTRCSCPLCLCAYGAARAFGFWPPAAGDWPPFSACPVAAGLGGFVYYEYRQIRSKTRRPKIPMSLLLAPLLLLTVIASAYDVQDKVARINAYDMPCTQPVGVRRAQLNGHRRARWLLCASRAPAYVPALARLHARMRRMPEQGSYEHVDCRYAECDSSVSPRLPILEVPVQPPLPTPIGVRPRPAARDHRRGRTRPT